MPAQFSPEAIARAVRPRPAPPSPAPPGPSALELGWSLLHWGARALWRSEQQWRQGESQVLQAARARGGWLDEAGLLEASGDDHRQAQGVARRLGAQGLCETYPARKGGHIYVFPSLLQGLPVCSYCDQDSRQPGETRCRCCGAPW